MTCIQVIEPSIGMNLGLFDISGELYKILFPGNQDLFFQDDIKKINLKWEIIRKEFIEANPTEINGIKGTIHLDGGSISSFFPNRIEAVDDPMQLNRKADVNDKNNFVQLLDGAANSTCDIYEIKQNVYEYLFKDSKYIKISESSFTELTNNFWEREVYLNPVDKKVIPKLDGIIALL